jgi:hypothetical protein
MSLPANALETVETEQPAALAISRRVTGISKYPMAKRNLFTNHPDDRPDIFMCKTFLPLSVIPLEGWAVFGIAITLLTNDSH